MARVWNPKACVPKMAQINISFCNFTFSHYEIWVRGGRGVAKGLGIRLFAFGGAYWPLATAHSDPLWVRTCFGCVNGAPG